MEFLSHWLPALVMAGCVLLPLVRGVPGYSLFLKGAQEGALAALNALPAILAMCCCVKIWGATNLGPLIMPYAQGLFSRIGVPAETLPLILLRPFSGGGALGMLGNLLSGAGPDSAAGRIGSVVMGCTETFFYTATVYYGAIRKPMGRGMLPRAVAVQLVTVVSAVLLCGLFFGQT